MSLLLGWTADLAKGTAPNLLLLSGAYLYLSSPAPSLPPLSSALSIWPHFARGGEKHGEERGRAGPVL